MIVSQYMSKLYQHYKVKYKNNKHIMRIQLFIIHLFTL